MRQQNAFPALCTEKRQVMKKWKRVVTGAAGVFGGILCLLSVLFTQKEVWQTAATEKADRREGECQRIAYLTFDDGPSILTKEYLKILKEEKVSATFFLIGQQIEGDMVSVVRQEVSEGHEVGLHTYSHEAEKIYQSKESYYEDLQKTKECLESKLNLQPKLFRFPWGSANSYIRSYKSAVIELMEQEGIGYADWNVSGEDSVGCPSPDSIIANVRKDYQKYSDPVILLHDSASCRATLQSLRPIIRELKENGYSFGTLSERGKPCHFGEY